MHGYSVSQKSLVGGFDSVRNKSKFNEYFIKNCNEDSNIKYFLEVVVQCHEKLHELHNDLHFLPEREKIGKVEKLLINLYYKKICCRDKKFKTSTKSWISIEKSA